MSRRWSRTWSRRSSADDLTFREVTELQLEATGWQSVLIILAGCLVAFVPWFVGVVALVDAALELVRR